MFFNLHERAKALLSLQNKYKNAICHLGRLLHFGQKVPGKKNDSVKSNEAKAP